MSRKYQGVGKYDKNTSIQYNYTYVTFYYGNTEFDVWGRKILSDTVVLLIDLKVWVKQVAETLPHINSLPECQRIHTTLC